MLQSQMPPSVYFETGPFEKEQESLFRSLWIFAGLQPTLVSKNAFFTRTIGGIPIVVTAGDDGTLRAFENMCAHRQMPIQSEAFGRRALICPYHAWTYDQTGQLRAVANAHLYQMRDSERKSTKLREFALKVVGKMVFVNLSQDPLPIEEQFSSEFLEAIAEASSYFDATYAYTNFECGYNWKLNFENVKDYNHVPFIHAKSFASLLDIPSVPPSSDDFREDVSWDQTVDREQEPSLADLSYTLVGPLKPSKTWYDPFVRRYPKGVGVNWNWYVYPNLNFGCLEGRQFYMEQYMPVSPSTTEYNLWVVTAERTEKRKDFTPLLRSLVEAHKSVVDEDKVYLESLQRKFHATSNGASYGLHEMPLHKMGRWYSYHVLNRA